jgi:hypothetical protein
VEDVRQEVLMKQAASILRALSGLARQAGSAYTQQRAQQQDLKDMAIRAERDGATHGKRFGPAVAFYRRHAGRIESSFAEYNASTGRYDWIWEPPDWREAASGIPEGAIRISEIARHGI